MLNKLASFFNYSIHGRGTKPRNMNNEKELICLKLIHLASVALSGGPCSTADQKGQLCILHAAVHTKCDTTQETV